MKHVINASIMEVSMTIAEMYNVLEKAIDSGKAIMDSGAFYLY